MISAIVATDKNKAIGLNNKLLFKIKEDMHRFKKITAGKTVIMGRKTYDSLSQKNKPLPNRVNIVLTKKCRKFLKTNKPHNNLFVMCEIFEKSIIEMQKSDKEFIVIGGAQIYKFFEPYIDKIYLTEVYNTYEADAFFDIDLNNFFEEESSFLKFDEDENVKYRFKTLKRKK